VSDVRFPRLTAKTETVIGTAADPRAYAGPAVPSQSVQDRVSILQLPPSFEYGAPSAGPFELLGTNDKALVGDVLRITYKLKLAWLEEWQTRFLVSRLNADTRFELRHVALNEELRILVVEVKVLKPFSPALLIPIAIIAVIAGGLIWVTTLSIERLGTVQVGNTTIKIGPLLVIAGLAVAALALVPRLKGLRGP